MSGASFGRNAAKIDKPASLREVAAIIGTNVPSVYAALRSGDFPRPVRISRPFKRSIWDKQSIFKWIDEGGCTRQVCAPIRTSKAQRLADH